MNFFTKTCMNIRYSGGFVSLTLVLTVSSVLLAFSYIQSTETFHFFDLALRKQYRVYAYYNAYSCISMSATLLSSHYFFSVTSPRVFSDLGCSIISLDIQGRERRVVVQGEYEGVSVYRRAVFLLYDDHVEFVSYD